MTQVYIAIKIQENISLFIFIYLFMADGIKLIFMLAHSRQFMKFSKFVGNKIKLIFKSAVFLYNFFFEIVTLTYFKISKMLFFIKLFNFFLF